MPRLSLFGGVVVAATLATGCGLQHSRSIGDTAPTPTPSTPSPSGTTNAPSVVGVWTANAEAVALPSSSTCNNFQFQIGSQTANSVAGTFTATCGNGLVVSGSANGQLNGSNVNINVNGSGSMSGLPLCPFSLTSTGTIEDNGNTLVLPYSGTTCFGPVHGTQTLHRPQAAAPAPAPAPAPPPPPPPSPSGPSDAIDLHSAIITGSSAQDVANWPITTAITGMDFQSNGVRVDFSKKDGPGRWPDVVPPGWDGPLQYTLWMVVNVNGRWYTSGGVEYWYGLDRQGGPPSQYTSNWYYSDLLWGPLATHQPRVGEQVGFFITAGDERVKDVTLVRERSQVVMVSFPSDNAGFYGFSLARTR